MESDKSDKVRKHNPSQLNWESTILLIWGESDRNRPGEQKIWQIKKKVLTLQKRNYYGKNVQQRRG